MTAPDPHRWPPTLDELKIVAQMKDSRDDARVSLELESAVAYVEGVRGGQVDFTGVAGDGRALPTATLRMGTIRLALRWLARGRSPDAMIASPEGGSVRVSTGDADIDKQLRLGRFALPVIA